MARFAAFWRDLRESWRRFFAARGAFLGFRALGFAVLGFARFAAKFPKIPPNNPARISPQSQPKNYARIRPQSRENPTNAPQKIAPKIPRFAKGFAASFNAVFAPFFLALCFCTAAAEPPNTEPLESSNAQAKLIYIKNEPLPATQKYVGQTVALKFNIIVLGGGEIRAVTFVQNPTVSLKNPNEQWKILEDGSLEATFFFKINKPNFTLPTLEVSTDGATEQSAGISGSAISLNRPNYIGVVAEELVIAHHSVKFYDQHNNIIILDLEARGANLEDLRLRRVKKQGFETSRFGITRSSGIYYAIVPNDLGDLELEYFNLQSQSFVPLVVKNIINKEQISVNQEINPVHKVLVFKNLALFVAALVLCGLIFVRRIPLKIRLCLLLAGLSLISYLVVSYNLKKSAILRQGASISILPTANSTTIEKLNERLEVEILNTHGDYYKVMTNSGKVGWTHRDNAMEKSEAAQ